MRIESDVLGSLEIREEDMVVFPQGIPGFEQLRRFVIVTPSADLPFSYLQAVEDHNVSLLLVNPFQFYPDYDFQLNDPVQDELQLTDVSEVAVWSVVSALDTFQEATLNLLAPIVINSRKKLGKQYILHQNTYRTKHPLFARQTAAGGDLHASTDPQKR